MNVLSRLTVRVGFQGSATVVRRTGIAARSRSWSAPPHRGILSAAVSGVALWWLALAGWAWGLAGEYGPRAAISHPDTWPARLVELAKQPARVGAYFVNQDDYLAFRGDTAQFQAVLDVCAGVPEFGPTTLHIHQGRGTFQPLDQAKKPVPCEWQLDVINQQWRSKEANPKGPMYSLELHVWLEGAVDVHALHIPASVKTARD